MVFSPWSLHCLAILQKLKENALQQNITALRKRVNELGVSEPIVQQQGADRILIQLAGVQDPTRAKDVIGRTATLELRNVAEEQASGPGRARFSFDLKFERHLLGL